MCDDFTITFHHCTSCLHCTMLLCIWILLCIQHHCITTLMDIMTEITYLFQIRSEHCLCALDLMYCNCRLPGHTQPIHFNLYIYKTLLDEGYVLIQCLEFTIDKLCVPCLAINPNWIVSHPRLYQPSYSSLTLKTLDPLPCPCSLIPYH